MISNLSVGTKNMKKCSKNHLKLLWKKIQMEKLVELIEKETGIKITFNDCIKEVQIVSFVLLIFSLVYGYQG